jgi:hypothetical protein
VLGFFSFTEVTGPGAHESYNRWRQLDHLPEQFSIDGISFGQRWVCSPRCLTERVAVSPRLEPCQYVPLYLLRDGGVLPEFFSLARRLRAEGRFFEARHSNLNGAFEVVERWAAPRVEVSAAAVPFRPATGIYVVAGPAAAPEGLREVDGVAGVWSFAPADGLEGWGEGRQEKVQPEEERPGRLTVVFVDGDLWEVSAHLGAICGRSGASFDWAGPLERVDPYHWDWFG